MDCPLPIDWLDYLEGREVDDAVGLAAHLADCRRCQALVAELSQQSTGIELTPYTGAALARAPKWVEEERPEIAVGQIWLTVGVGSGKTWTALRQLALVVAAREEFDQTWFSVAPLTTETELATNSDLLLDAEDTTLGVPLAAQFRLQTPLAREQLESCLGQATERGQELVTATLAGTLANEHFGAALTRANDRRLRRLEQTRELMAQLAIVYGEALTRAEETEAAAEALAEKEGGVGEMPVRDNPVKTAEDWVADKARRLAQRWPQREHHTEQEEWGEGAQVFVLQLKSVAPTVQEGALGLAASTVRATNPWINHFAIEGERCSLRARLELRGGMRGDEETLLLLIDEVAGFPAIPLLISFAKPTTASSRSLSMQSRASRSRSRVACWGSRRPRLMSLNCARRRKPR
jgi:hypothetical protein